MNEIKINIPEGIEIDKEHSTFECIKFKQIERKLPKTWEELGYIKGWHFDSNCTLFKDDILKVLPFNRNIFPTKELAEASLALTQLLQLREVYNDGWQPDWTNDSINKYCIFVDGNILKKACFSTSQIVMSFKTQELRNEFFENFKDLIEIAMPLL